MKFKNLIIYKCNICAKFQFVIIKIVFLIDKNILLNPKKDTKFHQKYTNRLPYLLERLSHAIICRPPHIAIYITNLR